MDRNDVMRESPDAADGAADAGCAVMLDDGALDAVQGGARPRSVRGPTTQTEDDLYVG